MVAYLFPEGQTHGDKTINCPCRPTLSYGPPPREELVCTHNRVDASVLEPKPEPEYAIPGASYDRANGGKWRR